MVARKLYPVCPFVHLERTFTPDTAVEPDDPMVALRPDLFSTTKGREAETTKE